MKHALGETGNNADKLLSAGREAVAQLIKEFATHEDTCRSLPLDVSDRTSISHFVGTIKSTYDQQVPASPDLLLLTASVWCNGNDVLLGEPVGPSFCNQLRP